MFSSRWPISGAATTILFAVLAAVGALSRALPAQVSVTGVTPANGGHSAQVADNVSLSLSAAADTPNSSNYVIHGGMSGKRAGAYSGGGTTTLTFDPTKDFFPGEEVEVTLTDALPLQAGGTLGAPYSWKFRAAAGTASAAFESVKAVKFGTKTSAASVALGDMDGDGDLDIVVESYVESYLLINDGLGNFSMGASFGTSQFPFALGDMDGDGDLDIVIGHVIYLNSGGGTFPTTRGFGVSGVTVTALALGDMNGDGYLDIVEGGTIRAVTPGFQSQYTHQRNYVHLNDGSGGLGAGAPFAIMNIYSTGGVNYTGWGTFVKTLCVGLGDVEGDGDLDIIVAHHKADYALWLNDGSGNLADYTVPDSFFGPPIPGVSQAASGSLALDDLDGDGYIDLVAVNSQGLNNFYINNTLGEFPIATPLGATGDSAYSMALGDLNGDGHLDIALGCLANQTNAIYMNRGGANFATRTEVSTKDTTNALALGDLDGDGDLDMVEGNYEWNQIYTNPAGITTPSDLVNARISQSYGPVIFVAGGGKAPYSWKISGSGFPSWANLSTLGVMTGTPPASEADKAYAFKVEATDATGVKTPTRSYTLYVNDVPKPLPWSDDFEAGILRYNRTVGANSRIQSSKEAKKSGAKGLLLDAQPDGINWSLQTGVGGAVAPGKAGADDPARWATDAASHMGTMEWSVDGTGVAAVAVSFDWQAVYSLQNWYTNLVFEVSDDLGATWTIWSGNGANAAGIYRPSGATTGYDTTSFTVTGFTPAAELKFRFRWLVKWALEDAFPTAVFIDNLSLTATTPPAGPLITTNSLPAASVGAAYDQTLSQTGGVGAVTWSATGLPTWLSLNSSTGRLTGTPPAGTTPTTLTLTITATDSASNSNTKTLTIAVVDVLTITTASLANAKEGIAYNVTLAAAGGTPGYTWTLADSLPTGMSFDDLLGILSGTPAGASAGSYSLSFTVTDSAGDTAMVTLALTVEPPPPLSITTTTLAQASATMFYTASLSVTGGVGPYIWNEDTPLPAWLSLDPFSGQLIGRPSIADRGEETLSFTVIDSGTPQQTQSVTLTLRVVIPQPALGAAGCTLTGGPMGAPMCGFLVTLLALIGLATRAIFRRAFP